VTDLEKRILHFFDQYIFRWMRNDVESAARSGSNYLAALIERSLALFDRKLLQIRRTLKWRNAAVSPPSTQKMGDVRAAREKMTLGARSLIDRLMDKRNQPPPSLLRSLPLQKQLEALVGMLDKSYVGGKDVYVDGEYLGYAGELFANAQVLEAAAMALAWMGRDDAAERRHIVGDFLASFYCCAPATENEVAALYAAAVRYKPSDKVDPYLQDLWDYVHLIQALMWANTWVRNQEVDVFLRRQSWLQKTGWLEMADDVMERRQCERD